MIKLYILTRARLNHQRTYAHIPDELKKNIVFVIDYNDDPDSYKEIYGKKTKVMSLPKSTYNSFPRICQHVLETAKEKYICILNDDLYFNTKNYKTMRILKSPPKDVVKMFAVIEGWLDEGVVHCGIANREAFYDSTKKYVDNSRIMHALFYNRKKVIASGCKFTKGVFKQFHMADMHMNLQLLEKGYPNKVLLEYSLGCSPSNAKGGASEHRTYEDQNKSSLYLKKNHKAVVKIVEKKNTWEGHTKTRIDVIVGWKKAYALSQDK